MRRAAGITQTDVEIAADTALAADAVLEAVPADIISIAARIIAVAVWAIPQGVLRGFEHQLDIANACDDADHQALLQTNLDVKVSTRATQTSVDTIGSNLTTAVTNISNSFTKRPGLDQHAEDRRRQHLRRRDDSDHERPEQHSTRQTRSSMRCRSP